jgi:phosphatidylglycerophosphate synthase
MNNDRSEREVTRASRAVSLADALTFLRLLLVLLIWPLAIQGHGLLVGLGLIAAGVTDFLDGYVARRSGQASPRGARLDAVADLVLLLSAAAWLEVLQPQIVRENVGLLGAAAALYAGGVAAAWIAFRRVVDPRQISSKIAGGLLYLFAVTALLTGAYEPLLLRVAVLALMISSVEGIIAAVGRRRAESRTIQAKGIASKTRSHAPQASNGVASNASPITSIPSSATPMTNDSEP